MAKMRIENSLAVATCLFSVVAAQDQAETCYGPGSVVGAVVGTLIVTLGLMSFCYFLYKMYWKNRKGKHLVLMTDAENPSDQYAFDNPCFREATPIKHSIQDEKQTSKLEKNKWLAWTPLHSFGKEQKSDKITSMDDSYVNGSRLKTVTLKSHDFTGLGFNICGNMRDGIFVKDVLHRGPAFESGCINSGDRIDSVCISFRNMVFEDALTILSYASPYDVQVQVENDSYSRPSTLIRSKRESNTVSSTEKIKHPKYNRSQSISHLNEIGKINNKKMAHQIDFMQEKNRINQCLNKSQEYHTNPSEHPTLKVSESRSKKENLKVEKNAASKISPLTDSKKDFDSKQQKASPGDPQNKLQKFGIKVLPISMNPKMGVQSVTGTKKPKDPPKNPLSVENEINSMKEKPEKPEKPLKPKPQTSSSLSSNVPSVTETPRKESPSIDEPDSNKENMKGMLAKGFQNLKEKINQNTLGKKKSKDSGESNTDNMDNPDSDEPREVSVTVSNTTSEDKKEHSSEGGDCPVPKLRSTVACGVAAYEKNQQNHLQTYNAVPEEVSRAGDVARNNRKSITDPMVVSARKSITNSVVESEDENQIIMVDKTKKTENTSDSDSLSDKDSFMASEDGKKPKRSKGKAPAPPQSGSDLKPLVSSKLSLSSKEINEIQKESELPKDEKMGIFEPMQSDRTISLHDDNDDIERNHLPSYDSDSDTESRSTHTSSPNTKIELNATQVTIHQIPSSDGNDEEIEPSRKAASLGDLSKLDSEQPLSIVLERAMSLYLNEGTSQNGKKRKAPLPPSEEFPAVFDDLNYRKEPRLENSLGLNTFQRRLKKSSDFGTLEEALYDGPKSLEIEVNKHGPSLDLTETHNNNIQEFSSWLAECRRPKSTSDESSTKVTSTSLININAPNLSGDEAGQEEKPQYEYQGNNVSFRVNGKNFPDYEINDKISPDSQNVNFPGVNSRTVVVISQPNSLEPTIMETVPVNCSNGDEKTVSKESKNETYGQSPSDGDTTFETANDSRDESFNSSIVGDDTTPPKLPTSPVPVSPSGNLSTPLSSSLTYITEIKVSTSEPNNNDSLISKQSDASSPSRSSMIDQFEIDSAEVATTPRTDFVKNLCEKIEKFDSKTSFTSKNFQISPKTKQNINDARENKDSDMLRKENHAVFESSKIPIRTMKSETGQKVLATIQSLAAKDSSPSKTPEVEYAKRVASLFSGNSPTQKHQGNFRQVSDIENENNRSNISELYLKNSPPKPSKDYTSTKKVPPVVPPRKMETSLSSKSMVTVELPFKGPENEKTTSNDSQERNIVTFSSFMPNNKNDEPGTPSKISFKIKEHGEINGGHLTGQGSEGVKTSATKIIFESKDNNNDF